MVRGEELRLRVSIAETNAGDRARMVMKMMVPRGEEALFRETKSWRNRELERILGW